jgi:hypothetical protein
MIKEGTRWWAGEGKKFIILALVEEDKNIWVHYREDIGDPPKEYSCYLESFLQRFNQLPE